MFASENLKPEPDPQTLEGLRAERALRLERQAFQFYAPKNLFLRTKEGAIQPFTLNKSQAYIHAQIEAQKELTGRVRVLILKARQIGASTYVAGRFYWRTTHESGKRTFILAHEQAASNNLFEIAQRFHTNDPEHPRVESSNAKELDFADLDSGYRVATAGSKATGRSGTVQFVHASEMAFWPSARDHMAGIMQSVPDMPGTEVIIESTANGIGNEFHSQWQLAEAGQSDYIPIFIPWFWQAEYRKPTPPNFALDEVEREYMDLHSISMEHMAWRRAKIAELGSDAKLFDQEYPANAALAFQVSGELSFIDPMVVAKARKNSCAAYGPLIYGVDPARFGNDRFSIAGRRGRKVLRVESRVKLDVVSGANWCRQIIDHERPAKMFIDMGGLGAGTVDILHSWGEHYRKIVMGVNFGGAPMEPVEYLKDGTKRPGPRNRRAEMWRRMRDWLQDDGGADIPDSDSLQADLCGPRYKYDMQQRLVLEPKEEMIARGIRSPDEGDALALSWSESVYDESAASTQFRPLVPSRVRDREIGV